MVRRKWSREELLVAFNLYCKLPFGQYHLRNPQVIELAGLLGRTPSAVAMKLCNLAAFDPTHRRRGIIGLKHAAKSDEEIWQEFNADWNRLALESEEALLRFKEIAPVDAVGTAATEVEDALEDMIPPSQQETEREQVVRVRLRQGFFRQTVLASYENQCCVCTLPCEALLVASHIIPWAQRPDLRVSPRNGLCLCALHDRAFDRGLMAVDQQFVLSISQRLRAYLPHDVLEQMFVRFEGVQIRQPEKFRPDLGFLLHHYTQIFQAN